MEAGSAQEGLSLEAPTLVVPIHDKGFPSHSSSWQDLEGTLLPTPSHWQEGPAGGTVGAKGQGPPFNHQLGPKPVHRPPFSPAQALKSTDHPLPPGQSEKAASNAAWPYSSPDFPYQTQHP